MNLPALVLADLHTQKSNLEEVTYLFKNTLPKLYNEYKYQSIVFIGDIFNSSSKIDTEVYTTVYQLFEVLNFKGIDVRIVAGNHDMYSYNTLISPLIPFKAISKIYTEYSTEDAFEFVPYSTPEKMNIKYLTKPGATFIHYTLQEIMDSLSIPYSMNYLYGMVSSKRVYLAGHIHIPVIKDNVVSLGTPVQYMFDPDKETSHNVYILSPSLKVEQIPLTLTIYNTIEVWKTSDLDISKIVRGEVSTYVKLKIMSDNITPSDILEFKKNSNCLVVLERKTKNQTENVISHMKSAKTLDVYMEFIKKSKTQLNKRELYTTVVEELKDADII